MSQWCISGRSLLGERGLKFEWKGEICLLYKSLSARRAWIEIFAYGEHGQSTRRSLLGERGLKLV